jgi:hypothetical protein
VIEEIKEDGIPFPTATRIEEVVGICLDNLQKVVTFPKFSPSSVELAILESWGETCNVVFHYSTNNILTARPKNVVR